MKTSVCCFRTWSFSTRALFLVFGLSLPFATGCASGDIGTVTGTVTAGGEPLAGAMVKFFPRPEGRMSSAMTDEDGNYELIYSRDQKGAKVGEHMVQITTAVETGDYSGTIAKEKLPAKYNLSSELKENVKPGHNEINFDLDFEGEIIQSAY